MKKKSILVDYLNFYTIIYIVLFRYEAAHLLYKHKFLNKLYCSILEACNVNITYLDITYPSNNFEHYRDIAIEKDRITNLNYSGNELLPNYLYKKYFYERVHPLVELNIFFSDLSFDRVLINYGDYFSLLKKEGFYKKIRYYGLPLFAKFKKGNYMFNYVYLQKKNFLLRTYFFSILKILRFSFSFKPSLTSKVLVATAFKQSFISDSFYAFDKSQIDYVAIDPGSLILYSNKGKKISHLYSLNFTKIFKIIKGIYKIYNEISIKNGSNIALNLHTLEKSKDIFFLKKLIYDLDVKVIYTCYEGSPIINILNMLGYQSNKVISACSMWSLGYMPEFINELYKGCDIFFAWGEKQSNNYLECKSPFRSLIKVGYVGDYAISYMIDKPETKIEELKKNGHKVIAVYDNVAISDYLVTYRQLHNFYQGLLCVLKEGSYACVIKTKFDSLYKNVDKRLIDDILSYSDRVVIMDEKSDLSPAFKSDFVYAFHQSSLGNIASVWGKKTIFYDESSFIDKNGISHNSHIINNYDQLIPTLNAIDKDSSIIDRDSYVDPFVDGNAQNRMIEYIQSLLSSTEKPKSNIIRESNVLYKRKYGDDKVLEKEGL